jgi:hypothetical protein
MRMRSFKIFVLNRVAGFLRSLNLKESAAGMPRRPMSCSDALHPGLIFAIVAVLLIFGAAPTRAQQGTGSIVGKVTDASGAAIPGATIIITNQGTLVGVKVSSNAAGEYSSPPLVSAQYTIEVEKESFGAISQNNFELNDDQRAELNFTLHPGDVTAEVVVQANAPSFNTFNATLGSVIDNATAEALPMNGGSAMSLLQMDSNAVNGFGTGSDGFIDRGMGVSNVRIGGGAVASNANLLDGANNLQNTRGEILINSTISGLQETRIQYGIVSSQYGLTSGGVITMTSKSGTDNFHGQVYENYKNGALNASNYFSAAGSRPILSYNQYGGAIGGPIKKDRAFIFGNFEVYKFNQVTPVIVTVPTLLERGGDFTDQSVNIYEPDSSTTASTRKQYVYQGTANVIDPTKQDAAAQAFQTAFVPKPNYGAAGALTNNYISNSPLISSQISSLGRIDYQVSNTISMFARYAYYANNNNNYGNYGALNLVASTRNDDMTNQDANIGLTQVLSGNLMNDIRVAIGRSYFPFTAGSTGQNWPQKLGLSNVPQTTLPNLSISGYGITVATNVGLRTTTDPEISDTVTWLRGHHSLHLGVGARFIDNYNNNNTYPSGYFSFSTSATSNGQNNTGNSYASFLTGKPGTVTATASAGSDVRAWAINGFIQEDWRATARLTLNLGLRYDYESIPWEKHNGFSTLKPNMINPAITSTIVYGTEVFAGVNGQGRNFAHENYHDIGPRVGFAFLLSSKHRTVVRGGYAMYFASTSNMLYSNATDGFGTATTTYAAATTYGYISQFQNGLPYAANGITGAGGGPSAMLGQSPTVQPEDAPTPMSQQFALSVDHEFAKNNVLTVSALLNHGTHFALGDINLNQLNPKYYPLGDAILNANTANPYANIGIVGTLGNAFITESARLKPYPYFQNVYEYYPHIGNFSGRSLQVSLQRPVGRSLQMRLTYSYSKFLSDPLMNSITVGYTPSTPLQNNYLPHSEYGFDSSDVTHRFAGNMTYALPFGKGKMLFAKSKPGLNRVVGGWTLSSTYSMETGRPLSLSTSISMARRPNFAPGVSVKVPHPSAAGWFNVAAFTVPTDYTFGNVPRTYTGIRGPGALNINMSLMKETTYRRFTSTLQASAFNIINKVNYGSVNTALPSTAVSSNPTSYGTFGTITTAQQSRNLLLTARIRF